MPLTITTWNVQNFARTQPVFDEKLNLPIATIQALGSAVIGVFGIPDEPKGACCSRHLSRGVDGEG
jgi:hypothetical protein